MPQSQPYAIPLTGGLNTNVNQFQLLAQPGFARELENFEVDIDGGYRRVNGFSAFGGASAARPNSDNAILGLFIYAGGVIAASGTNIYFSVDGTSWLLMNRSSVSASGDNFSTFSGRSTATRTNQGQVNFALYEGTTEHGELLITDEGGNNKPLFIKITGTGAVGNRTFFVKDITISGSATAKVGVIHDKHFVVAGDTDNPNQLSFSGTNDIDDFSSTGSGSIVIEDKIVGLRSFRDDLIIFCLNSIHRLENINNSSTIAVVPVTKNVGCLANGSIQEIGGDLVFLSPDGIRTLAGTVRIGDVELSSVSRAIQPLIRDIVSNMANNIFTSVVLRNKSQYRIFYTTLAQSPSNSKGIIGTIRDKGFEWSETKGIQARAITSGFDTDNNEQVYHGDNDGYIYVHDTGNSFVHDGSTVSIEATYQSPDFDFGDYGTRKTMNYVKISISPEGTCQPTLRVRYDYEDTNVPQPSDYTITNVRIPAVFGSAVFGSAEFGGTQDPMIRQTVQGTGNTTSFRIRSTDTNPPYALNGLYIDYTPINRR